MGKKEEVYIIQGLARRINNMIFGYEKPKGRPRGKTKKNKKRPRKSSK